MEILIITIQGYKYKGRQISEDSTFIELKDFKIGKIKVPISNISYLKELNTEGEGCVGE